MLKKIINTGEELAQRTKQLMSMGGVEDLDKATKLESIQIARDILDKLKNLLGSEASLEEALKDPQQETEDKILNPIKKLSIIFSEYLKLGKIINEKIINNLAIIKAIEAFGKLSYLLKFISIEQLINEQKTKEAKQIQLEISMMNDAFKQISSRHPAKNLIEEIGAGIEYLIKIIKDKQIEIKEKNANNELYHMKNESFEGERFRHNTMDDEQYTTTNLELQQEDLRNRIEKRENNITDINKQEQKKEDNDKKNALEDFSSILEQNNFKKLNNTVKPVDDSNKKFEHERRRQEQLRTRQLRHRMEIERRSREKRQLDNGSNNSNIRPSNSPDKKKADMSVSR